MRDEVIHIAMVEKEFEELHCNYATNSSKKASENNGDMKEIIRSVNICIIIPITTFLLCETHNDGGGKIASKSISHSLSKSTPI